jgi:hypothetical protein
VLLIVKIGVVIILNTYSDSIYNNNNIINRNDSGDKYYNIMIMMITIII